MEYENKCFVCNKKLVAVGRQRSNGKYHNDWSTRKTHKKCYPIYLEYLQSTSKKN